MVANTPASEAIIPGIDAQQARIDALEQELCNAKNFAGCAADEQEREQLRQVALEQDAARLREFAAKVAQQTPEKPDYWSPCG